MGRDDQADMQPKSGGRELGRSCDHVLLGKVPQWWGRGPGQAPGSVGAVQRTHRFRRTRAQD